MFLKMFFGLNPISIIHKFTQVFIVDMYTLKKNFIKKSNKTFKAIKITTKHKYLSQIYVTGRL